MRRSTIPMLAATLLAIAAPLVATHAHAGKTLDAIVASAVVNVDPRECDTRPLAVENLKPGEKYFIQETRFDITLEPDLPRQKTFITSELVAKLRAAYPLLTIESR